MTETNIDDFVEEVEQHMEALMLHWEDYFTGEQTTVDGDEYEGDDVVTTTLHDPAYKFQIEIERGYKHRGKDDDGELIVDCNYEGVSVYCRDNGEDLKKWLKVNIPEVLENIEMDS